MAEAIDSHEAGISVDAPPDRVWALVADVTRTGEWSPVCRTCRWMDDREIPEAGARFVGHNRRGAFRWTRECEVTASEPGRRFAFRTFFRGRPSTLWDYRFLPAGAGTEVVERYEAVLLPTWIRLLRLLPGATAKTRGDAARNIETSLTNLKRIAESEQEPAA